MDSHDTLTWSNIATKGEFPASNALIMLSIDTTIYLLLALYLDAVFPGEYGKAKHPLFLVSPSFWRNLFGKGHVNLQRQRSLMRSPSVKESALNTDDIEDVSEELLGQKVIRFVQVYICTLPSVAGNALF